MKKKLTVSIGIPAYNEEKGIGLLLSQIISQKARSYTLDHVYVRCDGCTDSTGDIVRGYASKHKCITCIDDGKRIGLAAGLNVLCALNTSDIFILLDADCSLDGTNVIDKIAKEFEDPAVGLVSGNALPAKGTNLIEKLAHTWIMCWYEARKNYLNGDNVNNHFGCVSAMSRELTKAVHVPKDVVGSPDYIYFLAKDLGFKYRFVVNAKVYYHVASTLQEYLKQTARHHGSKDPIIKMFGNKTISSYMIPRELKVQALIKSFITSPVLCVGACLLQVILRLSQKRLEEQRTDGLWTMIASTK